VIVLVTYNVYGLMVQKALSECMALILIMSCYLMFNDDIITTNILTFNSAIANDYLAYYTKFVLSFFSAIYFLIISDSLKEQKLTSFEYLLIILFAVLGILLMCNSNDLLTAYLAIELSSLSFYILASFKKTSSYSIESGLKYFVIGAISSSFFLLGSSLVYGVTGTINFSDFFNLFELSMFFKFPFFLKYSNAGADRFFTLDEIVDYINEVAWWDKHDPMDLSFIEFGLTFILFSLFIKLALAPFHLWSLDVYEGSPTSSTIFFATITKLSIFVLLIRLFTSFSSLWEYWEFYSVWVGSLSVFVGSFGGLKQRKLKTLIAYSSISHMGYAILAISTGSFIGIQMLLLYMVVYIISSLCLWFIILLLRLKNK
jgi:NADH-quinone oxidoreductase subunit N